MLFKDDFNFLSNFYPSKLFYRGTIWPTVEHAYQALKCSNPDDDEQIRVAPTPGLAKKLGFRAALRPDWEKVKVQCMLDVLLLKFTQHRDLKELLQLTEGLYLEEGNYWHDNFWGNCYCKKCINIQGKNVLGLSLMAIREELKNGL